MPEKDSHNMKIFFRHFSLGIQSWFSSWGFIFRNGLVHFFLYPILLTILLGMGMVALIRKGVNSLMALIAPHLEYTPLADAGWYEKSISILSDMGSYAISFLLWIIALYSFSKINKYLMLAVMSPVMTLLSERTETILTGKQFPFDMGQFVKDIVRGVSLAVRNFFVEVFIVIVVLWGINLMLTIFLPPLGVILSPFIALASFVISAYFYGFSTMDYYNERKKLSFQKSIRAIREQKGIAIGNGTLFLLIFSIPFIGVTISTITCTVAATLAMHQESNAESDLANQ